jgi:hypothetical protein
MKALGSVPVHQKGMGVGEAKMSSKRGSASKLITIWKKNARDPIRLR